MTSNGHVKMPKKAFVQEHKHLVKTLKHGSKAERAEEAKEQSGELVDLGESAEGESTHPDAKAFPAKYRGGR